MTVEHYEPEKHDATISSWYSDRGLLEGILPGTTSPFGAVASDDSGPVMAGFLYLAVGCATCFLERLVARPGNTAAEARDAGAAVFGFLCALAKQSGYEHIFCHVERPQLAFEMVALGFTIIGSNCTLLTYPL